MSREPAKNPTVVPPEIVDLLRDIQVPGTLATIRIIRCTCKPGDWPCMCEREAK